MKILGGIGRVVRIVAGVIGLLVFVAIAVRPTGLDSSTALLLAITLMASIFMITKD
jgi:uncharacterized membrane protein